MDVLTAHTIRVKLLIVYIYVIFNFKAVFKHETTKA